MKSNKFIKILNNTELGKGTTHETYVLITGGSDIDDVFKSFMYDQSVFVDKVDKTSITTIKKQGGRETRVVGLGVYYRKYDLTAGDILIFERVEDNVGSVNFYLSNIKKTNNLVLQKVGNKGFEILTNNTGENFPLLLSDCNWNNNKSQIEIKFKIRAPKRTDSPNSTDFYEIVIDGVQLPSRDKEMIEIVFLNNNKTMKVLKTWNKYTVQW